MIKEGQKRLDEDLKNYKIDKVADHLNRIKYLEQRIKEEKEKIDKTEEITVIPEGGVYKDSRYNNGFRE